MSANKNKKIQQNKKLYYSPSKWLFFVILHVLLLITGLIIQILSSLNLLNFDKFLSNFDFPLIFSLISCLVPLVSTIVSIVLSLNDETNMGLTKNQFNAIRKRYCYTILEICLISVSYIVLTAISAIFKFYIMQISIVICAVIMSIIFVYQQLALTDKNKNYTRNLIKKLYFDRCKNPNVSEKLFSQRENNDFETVKKWVLFHEGLVSYIDTFSSDGKVSKKDLLYDALETQNDFLFSVLDLIGSSMFANSAEYQGISLLKMVDISLRNIEDITVVNKDFDIYVLAKDFDSYYQVTRSIFCLKKISDSFHLKKIFNKEMSNICSNLIALISREKYDKKHNDYALNILNSMLANTLPSGETWWLEALFDCNSSIFLINKDYGYYFLFIGCYLSFLISSCYVEKNSITKINKFLDKKISNKSSRLSFGNGTYRSAFLFYINNLSYESSLSLLKELFNNFDPQPNNLFEIYIDGFYSSNEKGKFFDGRFITSCFLEMILNSDLCFELDKEKLLSIFSSVGKDNETFIYEELKQNWVIDDKIIQSSFPLSNLIGNKLNSDDVIKRMPYIIDALNEEKSKISYQKEIDIYSNNEDSKNIRDYLKELSNGFNKSIAELPFYSKDLKIDDCDLKYIPFLFDQHFLNDLVKTNNKQWSQTFQKWIYDEFKKIISPTIIENDIFDHTNNSFNVVFDFNPLFKCSDRDIYYATDEEAVKLNKIEIIKNMFFPGFVYLKSKDAIKVNGAYDETKSQIRPLTEKEVDSMIDRDFIKINGLYKYNSYVNDEKQSFLISRDKLKKLLSEKYIYAIFCFVFKCDINADEILYLEPKKISI